MADDEWTGPAVRIGCATRKKKSFPPFPRLPRLGVAEVSAWFLVWAVVVAVGSLVFCGDGVMVVFRSPCLLGSGNSIPCVYIGWLLPYVDLMVVASLVMGAWCGIRPGVVSSPLPLGEGRRRDVQGNRFMRQQGNETKTNLTARPGYSPEVFGRR